MNRSLHRPGPSTPSKASAGYAPPLAEWLGRTDALAPLHAGIGQITSIGRDLAQLLPDYLAASVEPGLIKGNTLVLFATHNALAARLRQIGPRLVADLQARGWALEALRIRVRPQPMPAAAPQKEAQMSPAGLTAIRTLSETLEPSPLQSALARMASRHMTKSCQAPPGSRWHNVTRLVQGTRNPQEHHGKRTNLSNDTG